jgi:hypothetical protein
LVLNIKPNAIRVAIAIILILGFADIVIFLNKANQESLWAGWTCKLIQRIHIMARTIIGRMTSKLNHKTVYFVTDSQQEVFYKQDCELIPFYSGAHANYDQLAGHDKANSVKLTPEIKSKMHLTHYQDLFRNFCDWDAKAVEGGFAGFVCVGQGFEL